LGRRRSASGGRGCYQWRVGHDDDGAEWRNIRGRKLGSVGIPVPQIIRRAAGGISRVRWTSHGLIDAVHEHGLNGEYLVFELQGVFPYTQLRPGVGFRQVSAGIAQAAEAAAIAAPARNTNHSPESAIEARTGSRRAHHW